MTMCLNKYILFLYINKLSRMCNDICVSVLLLHIFENFQTDDSLIVFQLSNIKKCQQSDA